jgi:hypothetical protein
LLPVTDIVTDVISSKTAFPAGRIRIAYTLKHIISLLATSPYSLPALSLFVANTSNSYSLHVMGIGNTYVTKCCIPAVTVLFTVLTNMYRSRGNRSSGQTSLPLPLLPLPKTLPLLFLIPLTIGISLSASTSPTVTRTGLGLAILSSVAQVSLNLSTQASLAVLCKDAVPSRPCDVIRFQGMMCAYGLMFIGLRFVFNSLYNSKVNVFRRGVLSRGVYSDDDDNELVPSSTTPSTTPPITLSFLTALAWHLEYTLSYKTIAVLKPVTFSVVDAVRRIGIIVCGQIFLKEEFQFLNFLGMGIAFLGVGGYAYYS